LYCIATDARSLKLLASGSSDDVAKVWDLVGLDEVWHTRAHDGMVKGLCWTNSSKAAGTGAGAAAVGRSGAAGVDQRCCFNQTVTSVGGQRPALCAVRRAHGVAAGALDAARAEVYMRNPASAMNVLRDHAHGRRVPPNRRGAGERVVRPLNPAVPTDIARFI
jgi:hypothetical protein